MRRWILYAAVAALLLFVAPVEKTDIGALVPVELVSVYRQRGKVCMETDTGNRGTGPTLDAALADMKETAAGTIFLETADYLVVSEDARYLIPQLTRILRPGTEVCMGEYADEQAAKFLKTHKPEVTLNDIRSGGAVLPVLIWTGESYQLES